MNSDYGPDSKLDQASFAAIADLAYRESGLQLVAEKTSMIQSRLRHRLRALGISTFEAYCRFILSESGTSERRMMISALTTNVSHFFRENHHFEILKSTIIPQVLPKVRAGGPLRIWSAGCSNGQEACSIAMVLLNSIPDAESLNIRVLATDIDPRVIEFAQAGEYSKKLVSGIQPDWLNKYFHEYRAKGELAYRTKPEIRKMITYRELNLLSAWPMKQMIDVIFCRNVVIYFDSRTQQTLWPRFNKVLTKEGYLFLGHSERIVDVDRMGFTNDGPTTYRPWSHGGSANISS
jgi:chemotaxis protein methyltransferase CheR